MKRLIFRTLWIFGFSLISSLAIASSKQVTIDVSLYPVGSFTVESNDIEGTLTKLKDQDIFTANELKVPVASLKTGLDLRDEHMRERMRHKEHKHVIISNIKAEKGKGTAKVTIGGISSSVDFTYKPQSEGYIEVSFPLDLTKYKIEDINYKGIGVEDEVSIKAIVSYSSK